MLDALICDAAREAEGRLYVLAGWDSYALRGPRKDVEGAIAGTLSDLADERVGKRVQIRAQLGTTDGKDAGSWRAVKAGGRAIETRTSRPVKPPSDGSQDRKAELPFVLELPAVDLRSKTYAWRVTAAGAATQVPYHDTLYSDIEPFPGGELFLCDAASVMADRLFLLGARGRRVLSRGDTQRWALAGRLASPVGAGLGEEEVEVTAVLETSDRDGVTALTAPVRFRSPPGPRSDWAYVEVPFAMTLPQIELGPGQYRWSVNGAEFGEVEFTVR